MFLYTLVSSLKGLFFDGRKDKVLSTVNKDGAKYITYVQEEHISMTGEPRNIYLWHVTPKTRKSSNIPNTIIDYILKKEIHTEMLLAVGADGTVINTEFKSGWYNYCK